MNDDKTIADHPFHVHIRSCKDCSEAYGHCSEGLRLLRMDDTPPQEDFISGEAAVQVARDRARFNYGLHSVDDKTPIDPIPVCVVCGHWGSLGDDGRCQLQVRATGSGVYNECRCKCEFSLSPTQEQCKDWQYALSLALPDDFPDDLLIKIVDAVEPYVRADTRAPSTAQPEVWDEAIRIAKDPQLVNMVGGSTGDALGTKYLIIAALESAKARSIAAAPQPSIRSRYTRPEFPIRDEASSTQSVEALAGMFTELYNCHTASKCAADDHEEFLKLKGMAEAYQDAARRCREFAPSAELIYEDTLPADMPKELYDRWYALSRVVDGVRMGPPLESLATPSQENQEES